MNRIMWAVIVLGFSATGLATGAWAKPVNLVSNGDFEINGGFGQLNGTATYATGWASADTSAYNFVVDTAADDSTGSLGHVWGPGNGVNNGFTGSSNGGFFLGLSGTNSPGSLLQTITGLAVGQQYDLEFVWAGSQLMGWTGDTSQYLSVTFGAETWSTASTAMASQGFLEWSSATHTFTATSAFQDLSFLASGSGSGALTLLDGVSLVLGEQQGGGGGSVPEPASGALVLLGTVLAYRFRAPRRRAKKDAVSA